MVHDESDPMGPDMPDELGDQRRIETESVGGRVVHGKIELENELPDGSLVEIRLVDQGVPTSSGDIILSPEQVAGVCAFCVEEGSETRHVAAQHVTHCARCGRLLCLRHRQSSVEEGPDGQLREVALCPVHAISIGDAALGLLALLVVAGMVVWVLMRGWAG